MYGVLRGDSVARVVSEAKSCQEKEDERKEGKKIDGRTYIPSTRTWTDRWTLRQVEDPGLEIRWPPPVQRL